MRKMGTNKEPPERSCVESSFRCVLLLPLSLLANVTGAYCCPRLSSPRPRPKEWNRGIGASIAILRSFTHNICHRVRCMRCVTDHRSSHNLPRGTIKTVVQSSRPRGEWTFCHQSMSDPRTTPPASETTVVLYFHGGAFCLCSPSTHRFLTTRLVANAASGNKGGESLAVFCVDFRRPPEHTHPSQVEDCVAAYDWLLGHMAKVEGEDKSSAAKRIVLGGDSAGGSLVALTLAELKRRRRRDASESFMPAGGIMLSPWVDFEDTRTASWEENKKYDYLTATLARFFARSFLGREPSVSLREVSPTNQNLEGLPPLLIMCGQREVLRDQVLEFSKKATEAGVDVNCTVEPGMVHVFLLFAPLVQKEVSDRWFGNTVKFIDKVVTVSCDDHG